MKMQLPDYITREEVKRVCDELGIRDWSSMQEFKVDLAEAEIILKVMDVQDLDIPPDVFRAGLAVELEHGTMYADANVTNNHPILTGKIVLAHLHETMDYYVRLDIAEIEGDMLKAAAGGDKEKLMAKYRKLVQVKHALAAGELNKLA